MKKLIVIKPNGNHSNRLFQNLYFEVFCKEHNIEFHNPTFHDMRDYYTDPSNSETNQLFKLLQIDLLGSWFRHSRLVKRLFSVVWIVSKLGFLKLIRFDNKNKESESETNLLKAFENNDVVYTAGWWFRSPDLVVKFQPEMAYKYSLKKSLYENNTMVINLDKLKSQGYILIGVHIRRGDYKKWKGGKYFYDDNTYKKYMKSISEQLSAKGNTKQMFILFSNETVNIEKSADIIVSTESWYIDQHIMSTCNYLIGPPSTFTKWASYIGNVKLFHITDKTQTIDIAHL